MNKSCFFSTAILLITFFFISSTSISAQNPWHNILENVPSIKVIDKKAAAFGSVEEGKEPVFEISLKDIGLYFGYITPPVAESYIMTMKALKVLYPDQLPERGQIRVAAQSETDFMLTASYITGARPYYFVKGFVNSDLVVDTAIRNDDGYAIYFQRKDNGKTVAALFNRKLIHDNEKDYMIAALTTIRLASGLELKDISPEEAKKLSFDLLELTIADDRGVIVIKEIDNYVFPEVKY
ncbi:MAG: hypothetical protein A2068_12270 [Ignavibacteria bacterium GWB2_35_6b]|nr:MAG: hypothetical protein A2068_12270 [Ignavibacteria bacterium GWB2_35_6b]